MCVCCQIVNLFQTVHQREHPQNKKSKSNAYTTQKTLHNPNSLIVPGIREIFGGLVKCSTCISTFNLLNAILNEYRYKWCSDLQGFELKRFRLSRIYRNGYK